jgi:hypothetical protein
LELNRHEAQLVYSSSASLIALFLGTIVLRQFLAPTVAKAQSADVYLLNIEPGTRMLRAPDNGRQVLGKVVVDLHNGNIWGFPTLTQEPYPIDATGNTKAPTSHAFLLGKFDFAATNK